jgi:UDP-glucose 4-epimerase
MSVLIVGGAGYIGSHVNNFFIEQNVDTVILDDLTNGNAEAISRASGFYIGDYGDKNLLRKIFAENYISSIIHLGGYISVHESTKHPMKYFYNNVYKTKILLKEAQKAKVESIIFASSAAVYGKNNSKYPIKERSNLRPSNPYGWSKLMCERMIAASGLRYCNLRLFNVSGCDGEIGEAHREEFHIIPKITEAHLNKRVFKLYGDSFNTHDGTCVRDYVHVKDVVQLIYQCYMSNRCTTLNVGSGKGISNLDLVSTFNSLGYEVRYEIVDAKRADPPVLIADIAKARKMFHWEPIYSDIQSIIFSNINWAKNRLY